MITDAILRYDGAEPQAEAIDDRGAHAARGDAASDDHGVDSIFAEERRSRRVEEDRWRTLAQNIIVGRIRNQRVEFGARITVTNLGNPINFPVRRVPLGMVAHVAGRDRNAGRARDLQESCRVLDRPPYQRGSTGCEYRIGERALEINHYDAGLLAEPDLPLAVAAFLVARHRVVSMVCRGSASSAQSLPRRLMIESPSGQPSINEAETSRPPSSTSRASAARPGSIAAIRPPSMPMSNVRALSQLTRRALRRMRSIGVLLIRLPPC